MRLRKIAAFLMAALMALSLLACGSENETNPATSNKTFISEEIVENTSAGESEHEDKENVDRSDSAAGAPTSTPASEPQQETKVIATPKPPSKPMPKDTSTKRSDGLTENQYSKITDYLDSFYSSIGDFSVSVKPDLFASDSIEKLEMTIWNSMIAVRERSLIDLHINHYNFSLRIADIRTISPSKVEIEVWESCDQQYAGLSVLSREFDIEHHFTLELGDDSIWRISNHKSECNPFYVFKYDASSNSDAKIGTVLSNIEMRNAQYGGEIKEEPACDHPYNRAAAVEYARQWVNARNPNYKAYDALGGNCMNFASQVLHAGGIRQTDGWFYESPKKFYRSWINVGGFTSYATSASPDKLLCDVNASYYSGQPGDLILMGIDSPTNHATIICDVVKDGGGRTVDYLLCSNTSNLENFPASAYYYTNQRLVQIFGWNDVPAEKLP